jgi:hypothetical protein
VASLVALAAALKLPNAKAGFLDSENTLKGLPIEEISVAPTVA